jgi:hypothetical protein
MLHTTRRQDGDCDRASQFGSRFGFACHQYSSSIATSALVDFADSHKPEQTKVSTYPYGTDPSFLRSSVLYNPKAEPVSSYNMTPYSEGGEAAATGAPFGFYHRDLQGYPLGFPVLLINAMSSTRAAESIAFLMGGNYLDSQVIY